jgi:hypothetical protein
MTAKEAQRYDLRQTTIKLLRQELANLEKSTLEETSR